MSPRALIINADDLGYDPAVTRGILHAMREGIVSSATFMVNTPYSEEAARAGAGARPSACTSTWRAARPCGAASPRSCSQDGGLRRKPAPPRCRRARWRPRPSPSWSGWRGCSGRPATHVDVHKHLHRHPSVLGGLVRAAARSRAAGALHRRGHAAASCESQGVATNAHFVGDAGAEAYWTLERFEPHVAALPPTASSS